METIKRIKIALLTVLSYLGLISVVSAQCLPGEVEVSIDVTTDGWGYECYWEIGRAHV